MRKNLGLTFKQLFLLSAILSYVCGTAESEARICIVKVSLRVQALPVCCVSFFFCKSKVKANFACN